MKTIINFGLSFFKYFLLSLGVLGVFVGVVLGFCIGNSGWKIVAGSGMIMLLAYVLDILQKD